MQTDFYRFNTIEVMAVKFKLKDKFNQEKLFLFTIISVCIWSDIIYENMMKMHNKYVDTYLLL